MTSLLRAATLAVAALIATTGAADAATESRIALVVGNSRYIESALRNPTNDARAMAAALREHGFDVILRTDAKLTTEQRIKLEAVDVDAVLDQMQGARSKVNVVILDACRNNPFERRFRSASGGLAQINAPERTLIAYATAPGRVAADGEGENGLYTNEPLKALRTPGLRIEDVFKQVRINVSRASNGGQTP